ncbi:hypothetical protein N7530_005640 [Penicillium desertorum]|uniref:NACHT domain-containing protein n=1 Tax=Penicillium desertorum TaxID=1303715 RepID=A0A9W9X0H4_9EURO|nr:hypothetical protein N7530_005640 [Penicillium desertorum]
MSFGFSLGDFISVITLANKLRKDFVGAPSQFNSISREVRGLANILQDVDIQLLGHDINDRQQKQLAEISHSCGILLNELQDAMEKYKVVRYSGTSIHKKARSIWKRISWEPEDISELRGRLMSNVMLLQSFVSAISRQTMVATKQTLEHLNQRQESDERSCILDWLSAADYTSQQSDLLARRQEGTGQWLLDSEEYKHWLRTPRATLFCPGIPGAGKTICSAILVDDLITRFQDNPNVGIAYIYCKFNRQDEQKVQDLLSSLLKQLSEKRTSVPDAVKDLYTRYKATSTRPQFDKVSKALRSVASTYSEVFIVVDALDECESTCRTRLLDEMMEIHAGAGANIFATSRPAEMNDLFKAGGRLEIRAHENDVRRYLNGNMYRLPGFVSRNTALQEEIMTVISRHVQGMFLLAQLYFESLIGRRSAKSTRTALKELSDGSNDYAYDKAYDNAMGRIQGQLREQADLAIQTLSWLTCARRPLTSLELQHALAIENGESSLDEENMPEIEDILTVCAGLVTLENETGIIRLVHYTTKEYLERKQESFFLLSEKEISTLCISYISFETFGSGVCESDITMEERLQSHPFYPYAARYWGDHVRATKDLHPGVIQFLEDQPKVEASEQALRVTKDTVRVGWSQKYSRTMTGLHLAAYFGIQEAVAYFLRHQHPVDICYRAGYTALKWAISGGHLNVCQFLLSQGADPNITDEEEFTELAFAAQHGREAIVRLLVDWGADVDAPCEWYGRALIAACDEGQLKIVDVLLNSKADINIESELYGSPLETAANAGHWKLVTFLLEKGAEPNSRGGEVATVLQSAAFQGQEEIVRILLSHGADVNRQGGLYGNALRAASMNGNQHIVQLLLDSGANINAEHELGTALIAAVEKGHCDIAQMLLENGADPNGRGRVHGTALHAAAAFGLVQITQILLDKGADSTIRAGVYKTPLRAAVMRGHREVVALLKDRGSM